MKGFAELHTGDGQPMFIRPEEVVTIQSDDDGGCYLITKSGPHIRVTEPPYEVAAKLGSVEKEA